MSESLQDNEHERANDCDDVQQRAGDGDGDDGGGDGAGGGRALTC